MHICSLPNIALQMANADSACTLPSARCRLLRHPRVPFRNRRRKVFDALRQHESQCHGMNVRSRRVAQAAPLAHPQHAILASGLPVNLKPRASAIPRTNRSLSHI